MVSVGDANAQTRDIDILDDVAATGGGRLQRGDSAVGQDHFRSHQHLGAAPGPRNASTRGPRQLGPVSTEKSSNIRELRSA